MQKGKYMFYTACNIHKRFSRFLNVFIVGDLRVLPEVNAYSSKRNIFYFFENSCINFFKQIKRDFNTA